MSRPPWFGLPGFLRNPRDSSSPSPEIQGLVLGGGGAMASFQIGALRYLYERSHIAPTAITATSGGSVLGVILAQWLNPQRQHESLLEVEKLWLGMQRQSDIFTERPWFAALRKDAPTWLKLVPPSEPTPPTRGRLSLTHLNWFDRDDESEEIVADDNDVVDAQQATLALAMADDNAEPLSWSPSVLMQLVSALPKIGRAGADLATALRAAERSRSLYRPGPILVELLSPRLFLASRIVDSGVKLRVSFVGLNKGALNYMREDGVIVDRDNQPLDGTQFNLSMGALASCSIPGVFKPVQMNDEWYVDGGVRENVPVEAAVEQLGVTKPYVIVAGTPGLIEEDYSRRDVVSLMMRASRIQSDETERDEVAYARSIGAVVIEPELFVHDSMTVDPGLLAINRDYGWLRAAEVETNAGPATQELHRKLISARLAAWKLEGELLERAAMPERGSQANDDEHREDLARLSQIKADIRALLARADRRLLPERTDRWWTGFEAHPGPEPAQ